MSAPAIRRTVRVPEDLLRSVGAVLSEIGQYRHAMSSCDFEIYPHGQLLLGYIAGVAATLGVDRQSLIELAIPYTDDVTGALWVSPS